MSIKDDIEKHALESMPAESCGLIIIKKGRKKYIPCRNIASMGNFAIHPEDYANAEDMGVIDTVVHSHVNIPALPSPSDLVQCELTDFKWLIISVPNMQTHEFKPSGYVMPLYGRSFNHGTVDCYTFVRDFYKQELNIELPNFDRTDNWWLSDENLYLENYSKAKFVETDNLEKNDVILMTIGGSKVPNHGAIYLGDGRIGHHQQDRLSSIDVYGGYHQKMTSKLLRFIS